MSGSPFADLRGLPFYDEPALYIHLGGMIRGWEFGGWKRESMSWKTGCYIHTGLSGPQFRLRRTGRRGVLRDLLQQLREVSDRQHEAWRDVQRRGLVATHGILQRNAEEEYRWFARRSLADVSAGQDLARCRVAMRPRGYLTQIAGPARSMRWNGPPARTCATSVS